MRTYGSTRINAEFWINADFYGGIMIRVIDGVFYLKTLETEYIFRLTKYGHLEFVYYGFGCKWL